MSVARKRTKMRRTQISLTIEDYDVARRIAAERHKSLSQVFREALRREAEAQRLSADPLKDFIEAEAQRLRADPLRDFIGIVTDRIPHASETIDEVVYDDSLR